MSRQHGSHRYLCLAPASIQAGQKLHLVLRRVLMASHEPQILVYIIYLER